ncbi:FAD/FMN-containing dehydrogenase [Oceanobacillus limi]|uniref:FAD/FMN-containing dehydrogenase n=1 Tax=Oceanobacillus limi TaxID=930131 RepID=A0A1I0FPB3_9BACI|nr:FAD-binding oxidoreductase [Oceanobacillus limi]SET59155.1 FAD/FMN-containing dehydrogenase [Oceanobacillus limi]
MEYDVSIEKSGKIILPNHDLYDDKRKVWNNRFDRRPAVIFECKSEADVVSAVNYANDQDLEVSIHGGGHHLAGTAVCDGGVMVDLSNMNKVTVDKERQIAVVEGGAKLSDIDHETQKYGLATPTGTVSETGIGGLALGGGFGYLRGKYGLTCDNIKSVRMVTAEGELLHVNEENHSDLFWAIRGGGGNFGVVTSFEFQLHPVGPNVLALDVMYDYKDVHQILNRLKEYMITASDEVSVNLAIMQLPPADFLPEFLHHKRVITLSGMYLGQLSREVEETIIEPLVKLAEPIMDNTGIMPYVQLQSKLDPMVPRGVSFDGTSLFFKELTDEAIQLLTKAIDESEVSTIVQLWALHGQMNRTSPHDTAFAIRDANYLLLVDGEIPDESPAKCTEWMDSLYKKLEPYSHKGASYLNGANLDHEIMLKTYRDNYRRLADIKGKYDPKNIFCHNHNIEPA